MKIVKLYGHLGKKFGKLHKFDVRTPAEAVCALMANFSDFKEYMIKYSEPGYKILVGNENRTYVEGLVLPADEKTISIIPVIAGSGFDFKSAAFIVVGALLVIYAPAIAASVGGMFGASAATVTTLTAITVSIGTSLVLSGISSVLFKAPKLAEADKENKNTYFNGPVNLSTQGNPVPLAYGKVMVGSQVISTSIKSVKPNYPPKAIANDSYFSLVETIPPFAVELIGKDIQPDKSQDGTITGFIVTKLPNNGKLYLNSAKTQLVQLNQVISSNIEFGERTGGTGIFTLFSTEPAYIRTVYYDPPLASTVQDNSFWVFHTSHYENAPLGFGSDTVTFKVVDDMGVHSPEVTINIAWDQNAPYSSG